jgi:Domain of unknown function (DUF4431)
MLVAAALGALPQSTIAASQCVEYGPASLAGTFVRQTYAGPPDYESLTKGDEPQIIWVLQLYERTCVYSGSTYTVGYGEREVELVLNSAQYERYREFLGKAVIVVGELVRGGARHEKRLVLLVDEMKKAPTLRSSAHLFAPGCHC